MSTPSITFFKLRDFGEKMSTTVDFIKENFKKLSWSLLLIGGPIAVIVALVFRDMFSNMFQFMDVADESGVGSFLSRMGINYFLMMSLTWITTMMILSVTYNFMIKYNNGDLDDFSVGELFGLALKKLPGLLLLSFIIFAATIVGLFIFVLPGIYLGVVFTLAYPVYLFEKDATVGEALSKPFTLIKGKWWSTFGTAVIGYLMAYAIQIVFSLPFLIIYFIELFTIVEEAQNDPTSFMNMFSSGYMTISMAFQYIGQYCSLCIPFIAIAFQYSNLVERTEGRGLMAEIDEFDKEG